MLITGIYASLFALLLIALSARVIRLRRGFQVGIGTGGKEELARAIRVQGNFTEYVPLALILLGIAESLAAPTWLLHLAGVTLLVGRLIHAQGLSSAPGRTPGRFYGMVLTYTTMIVLAATNLTAPLWS
ncbi:MAG: MAPEG family protein [Gammaproteobacteria bacterium]|nr:MAPEG family protein [Gammaproteobacteria bacterium]